MTCPEHQSDDEQEQEVTMAILNISHEELILSLKCIHKLCIGNQNLFEMVNSIHHQLQSQKTAVELNSKIKQSSIMSFFDKHGTV